jgi:hypothetical protein
MTIQLHIERLVLDGLPLAPGQQYLLQSALLVELGRLLRQDGLAAALAGGAATPRITAPAINLPQGAAAVTIGLQIAGALHGGLGQ